MRALHLAYLVLLSLSALQLASCSSNVQASDSENSSPEPAYQEYAIHFDDYWAIPKSWDDGRSELLVYDAVREINGRSYPYQMTMLAVKEVLNREHGLKSRSLDREDLFEVIKLTQVSRIESEGMARNEMNTIFLHRERLQDLFKLRSSTQEWSGMTFKEFEKEGGDFNFTYHSQWDGEGSGKVSVPGNVLFEDQLLFSLRALKFHEGQRFRALLIPTQMNNRAILPDPLPVTFSMTADSNAWKVSLDRGHQRYDHYWFDQKAPQYLIKMECHDGRSLCLRSHGRQSYW